MSTLTTVIETNENGVKWVEINGTDRGTNISFENEIFGITEDGTVLDCDGCPMTDGDRETIAVRNSYEKMCIEA